VAAYPRWTGAKRVSGKTPLVGNPAKHLLLKSWISSLALLIVRLAVSPGAYEFDPTA
jgi:hypothetical protein